jgi:CheY-like chemotaxis protein
VSHAGFLRFEALSILRKKASLDDPVRLVLLDMQMPEMDGEQVLKEIKTDPNLRPAKVIILTSIGHRETPPAWKPWAARLTC